MKHRLSPLDIILCFGWGWARHFIEWNVSDILRLGINPTLCSVIAYQAINSLVFWPRKMCAPVRFVQAAGTLGQSLAQSGASDKVGSHHFELQFSDVLKFCDADTYCSHPKFAFGVAESTAWKIESPLKWQLETQDMCKNRLRSTWISLPTRRQCRTCILAIPPLALPGLIILSMWLAWFFAWFRNDNRWDSREMFRKIRY